WRRGCRKRRRRGGRRRAASGRRRGHSLTGGDLLQLGVELVEDLPGVDALRAGLLYPVVDDGRGALLDLRREGRIGVDDLDARLLQGVQALLVGLVPGAPGEPRDVLAGQLLDRRLIF